MKTITEALIEVSNQTKRKVTYMDLAKVLGYTKQYVSQIKNEELTLAQKEKIEKHYNINLLSIPVNADSITLDFYPDIKASCGNGNYIETEAKEQIAIPSQVITNYSTHNKYTVIKATSDSMTPEIKPNDFLVVQHNIEKITDNHIYIFSFAGELYCKYLSNNLGQIVVRSANSVYPIRYIEGEALKDFRLIGEVKAHIREYEI